MHVLIGSPGQQFLNPAGHLLDVGPVEKMSQIATVAAVQCRADHAVRIGDGTDDRSFHRGHSTRSQSAAHYAPGGHRHYDFVSVTAAVVVRVAGCLSGQARTVAAQMDIRSLRVFPILDSRLTLGFRPLG